MDTNHRAIALVLFGVWLLLTFTVFGCTPKMGPSERYLDSPEHHVQSGMMLLRWGKRDDAIRAGIIPMILHIFSIQPPLIHFSRWATIKPCIVVLSIHIIFHSSSANKLAHTRKFFIDFGK